jgi:RNA ligase
MKFNRKILDHYLQGESQFCVEKHPDTDLYIYGYDSRKPNRKTWDNFNINMRGLIVDAEGEVEAMSFKKFFTFRNYLSPKLIALSEENTLRLPQEDYIITEKVDGTMGLLYWINDVPYIATQRSFKAINAQRASQILHNKYSHLFDKIDKSKSYIFEVLFPESRVLIDYGDREDLILIGVIDKATGKEETHLHHDIGFPVAKDYTQEFGHIKKFDELKSLNIPNLEGFVITYLESGLKIKIKFPWFDEAHDALNDIIHYSHKIRRVRMQFYKLMNVNRNLLSNVTIWEYLQSGKSESEIFRRIPYDYYFHDFDVWFNGQLQQLIENFNILKQSNKKLTEKEIWEQIKPQKIEYFDVEERLTQPEYSSVMWKLIERESNMFH